jgi:hypothetical protein
MRKVFIFLFILFIINTNYGRSINNPHFYQTSLSSYTPITAGMSPSDFINTMNANFQGIGTTLTSSSTITDINNNFNTFASLFSLSLEIGRASCRERV